MKKLLLVLLASTLLMLTIPSALAGDCKTRNTVDWHATISSAVFLRSDCPSGDVLGTLPAGEMVKILEVDRYNEFYLIETSAGVGFVFESFLKNITESPLPGSQPTTYSNSIFSDLDPNHEYYDEISDVKERGIVSGTPDGKILADDPINRAELSKILVEATTDNDEIDAAVLGSGVYSDVQLGAWYTPYLEIARTRLIMTGDSGRTTVRPGDNANGAEVAKMIAIAFGMDIPGAPNVEWYVPYMDVLESLGALPYSDPDHQVTRGEMMFMVSSVLD